ncbi:hypothetical protein LTR84_002818 [Exophiala bonariae]|uniref:Uncharacterized protein n=1 Tax=Exophiala bonariae TaxID=1690606 RepID=A0AAV9N905_9EURO|nr:hypothetical protein LTR84_002818 [Exophiala bonariae]
MSICLWVSEILSKLITRTSLPDANGKKQTAKPRLTPALSKNPLPHNPERKDHHWQYYPSRACVPSEATRGWRIPRTNPSALPARRDRHSTHCTAAGILFSTTKLTPRAERNAQMKQRNHDYYNDQEGHRTVRPRENKDRAVAGPSGKVPARNLDGGPTTTTTTTTHEVLKDEWKGNHPAAQGWISMEPIIGRA